MLDNVKRWLAAAGIRALKTAAEGALIVIGTNSMFIGDVDWLMVLSGAVMGAITSVLFSLKGIPEVDDGASIFNIVRDEENYREGTE